MSVEPPASSRPGKAAKRTLPKTGRWWLSVLLFAASLLTLSMGHYTVESSSWRSGPRHGVRRSYEVGFPAWMTIRQFASLGSVPMPVPTGNRAPGVFVEFTRLAVSMSMALLLAVALAAPLFSRINQASTLVLGLIWLGVLLIFVTSAVLGYLMPQGRLAWQAAPIELLVIAVPISVLVLAMVHRSYWLTLYTSAFFIVVIWWGKRVSWWWRPADPDRVPPEPDLELVANLMIMFGMLSTVTCLALWGLNRLRGTRSN